MLKKLIIEQFVIIDSLELDFQSGLTVLTGETGAGKSILLDALGLLLGDPANPAAVRAGADQSRIEGVFAPPPSNPVWALLLSRGLVTEGAESFSIRRIMRREGANDVLINDKVVDLGFLKKIGASLTEIHGQFANQSLLDSSNQLTLLDLAGAIPADLFHNVATSLQNYHRYIQEQTDEGEFYRKNVNLIGAMEDRANRIAATGLMDSDFEAIRTEYNRLLTAQETSEAFLEIRTQLIASNGAIRALASANMALERQKNLDADKIKNLTSYLSIALQQARAAHEETARLEPEYNIDTAPLRRYKDKMTAIQKLSEEFKVPVEGLAAYCAELRNTVARVRNSMERIKELDRLIQTAEDDYRRYAHELTERRMAAGEILSRSINDLLPPLKLMRAQFMVQVDERPEKELWTERGFNTITFMARMNPGQAFSSITETASGGELARLVLAVKVVLQRLQAIPTLIFDEIDIGIGGAAASAVGERIAHLSESTQVMVITHSPQVASRGLQHLHVSKKSDGSTTTSVVRVLTPAERISELSRMLAGDKNTAESDAAAARLIEEAREAAAARREGRVDRPMDIKIAS